MNRKFPKGFVSFLATESLGAFNDNFYKMLMQLFFLVIVRRADAETLIASAGMAFTIPYVLFGPWAGWLADRFSKTGVMQGVKILEILIMAGGVLAFHFQNVPSMILILFFMAVHSTFFSPAKAGFIPEACHTELITKANSLVGLTTFLSIIMGTAIAGVLLSFHENQILKVSYYCVAVALLGAFVSRFITPTKAVGASTSFPLNPVRGICSDIKFLKGKKGLFLASLAVSYFWLLGFVFQTNILVYGTKLLGLSENNNTLLSALPAIMGIGLAGGSLLAGRWSGKKVELGLVPLGGFGLTVCGLALFFSTSSYPLTASILFIAGICGGLFIIPLTAYLQFEAESHEKGRVLATNGILNGLFLVLGAIIYQLLAVWLNLKAHQIYLIMGLATLGATLYICTVIPEYFVRFVGWLATHTVYRIKIIGAENVPFTGPALLAPNHVSFVDALLVGGTIQRFVKFIMYKKIYEIPGIRQFCRIMEVIPIAPYEGRKSVAQSLDTARQKLKTGEVVCIFAEGQITRHGEINEFKTGLETIMEGMDCPIIPVYLHNVWGSIFSFEGNRVFWKWPKRIPYKVTVIYGKPLSPRATAMEVEEAVRRLSIQTDEKSG